MSSINNANALKNGLYSKHALLPWEDAQLFGAVHQEYRASLNPSGYMQEDKVFEIAKQDWRKRRLAMSELLPFYEVAVTAELLEAAKGGVAMLAAYILQNRCGSMKGASNSPTSTAKAMSGETIEQAYDVAKLEKILRAETMIDNRIHKLVAELDQLKSYEKMHGKKKSGGDEPASEPAPASDADLVVSDQWYNFSRFLRPGN